MQNCFLKGYKVFSIIIMTNQSAKSSIGSILSAKVFPKLEIKRKTQQRLFFYSCVILLSLTIFLHFWQLGIVPNGFFIDESAVGYSAYSIAETGADEYGERYPLFFRCFDNYHEPVMVYILVPLVKIFGLTKSVVRFPSAFFYIISAIIFFSLSFRYTRDRWLSLISAFVYSILPWAFPISRLGIGGYTVMLGGICVGWLYLLKGIGKRNHRFVILGGLGWAAAMYSHNIGRPMTALLLICFVLVYNKFLLRRWKVFLTFVISYVLFLIPMILYVFYHPESMTSRFNEISVWRDGAGTGEVLNRIITRYTEYFSPSYLFIAGDNNLRHHAGPAGELYIFLLPFIILGLYLTIRHFRRNPYYRFALMGLLIYPFAAVLTIDHMHSMRSLNGVPFWCIMGLIGLKFVWRKREKLRILTAVAAVLAVYEISLYCVNYFGKYKSLSRDAFAAPLIEAFEYSFEELKGGGTLYLSASIFPQTVNTNFKPYWYSHILFFEKVNPAVYQEHGIPRDYVCPYEGKISATGIFLRSNSTIVIGKDGQSIGIVENTEPIPEKRKLLRKIELSPERNRYFEIYRVY